MSKENDYTQPSPFQCIYAPYTALGYQEWMGDFMIHFKRVRDTPEKDENGDFLEVEDG